MLFSHRSSSNIHIFSDPNLFLSQFRDFLFLHIPAYGAVSAVSLKGSRESRKSGAGGGGSVVSVASVKSVKSVNSSTRQKSK